MDPIVDQELIELDDSSTDELTNMEIDLLLEGLYRWYGFDFRQYVRASLRRRVLNRMRLDRIPTVTALLNLVLHEPGYVDRLLGDFSIKVTEMFRDPSFFRAFRYNVVPQLRHLSEIRIWHAGCATGEEVYSMAILLQEEGLADRTKLYATDMNEKAIEAAKRGAYPLKQMQTFTKNYLDSGGTNSFSEYYTTDHKQAYFDASLREHVMFAQHNLVTDGSFNEFHVILCRNVLIYFDAALQSQVHNLFHGSLSTGGFLGLGSKESILLLHHASVYEEFVPTERIYRKMR
ncbi:CheR family methyltransferase [Paenibacillus koleovorans]|uniref:CheR family methyltransferase n=1 Tax=Paenibacillus koleovorans TaxID=121608 RepID=UPI000FDBF622